MSDEWDLERDVILSQLRKHDHESLWGIDYQYYWGKHDPHTAKLFLGLNLEIHSWVMFVGGREIPRGFHSIMRALQEHKNKLRGILRNGTETTLSTEGEQNDT